MTSGSCFMPTVKVLVNDKVWARAALDTCSSNSFCTQSLSKSLGLEGPISHYTLKTMSSVAAVQSKQVSMKISSGDESMYITGLKVVESIPVSSASLDQNMYPHLQDLDVSANIECYEVDILIGQDFADAFFPLETRKGNPGDPYAVRYKFGWGLNGRAPNQSVNNLVICNLVSANRATPCESQYSEFQPISDMKCPPESEHEGKTTPKMLVLHKVTQPCDKNCRKHGIHNELHITGKGDKVELSSHEIVLPIKDSSASEVTRNSMLIFVSFFLLLSLVTPWGLSAKLPVQNATRLRLGGVDTIQTYIDMNCNVWPEPSNILPQLQCPRCVKLFPCGDNHFVYHVISVVGENINDAGTHVWLFTITDLVSLSQCQSFHVPHKRLCDLDFNSRDQIVKGKLSNKLINYTGPLSNL